MSAPETTGIRQWWADHPEEQEAAEEFIRALKLDTDERWGTALQPWQIALYASILGFPDAPCGERQLVECCGVVGAGKDQIIAATMLAALHFGPKGFKGLCYSTDREKSKEVIKCLNGFLLREPRAGIGINVNRGVIRNICEDDSGHGCKKDKCDGGRACSTFKRATMHKAQVPGGPGSRGGVIVCESADESSAVGVIYDIAWMNEVQGWAHHTAPDTYGQVFARFGKRKGRLVCLTNAPKTERGEWRRDRWEEARREGSDWWYIEARLENCPWISEEYVALQMRNLPTLKGRRWFYLEPSDGGGDLLTAAEIDRCTFAQLAPAAGPNIPGKRWSAVDIGIKHDHATILTGVLTRGNALVLERADVWVPSLQESGEVKLGEVEAQLLKYGRKWRSHLLFDPSQAQSMRQRLEARAIKCTIVNATPGNLSEQTDAILELFREQRVRLFPGAGFVQIDENTSTSLRSQLLAAEVKEQERNSGVRIVHKRTKAGHGDLAAAFAMLAQAVVAEGRLALPVCVARQEEDEPGPSSMVRRGRGKIAELMRRHTGRYTGPRPSRRRTA